MFVIRRTLRLGCFQNSLNLSQNFGCKSKIEASCSHFRNYASTAADVQASEKIQQVLQERFPLAKKIIVNDLSGGCGSMYEIFVETEEFKGLSLVKQHMLINETLKEHIKNMHGLTVKTKIPATESS